MQAIVRNSLAASNLHNAGSNQSDCNFGYTAGVAEALLQSHAGEISLLPALPDGWTDGSVTGSAGTRRRSKSASSGRPGKLVSAELRSNTPGTYRVRSGQKTVTRPVAGGQVLKLNGDLVSGDDVKGQP